MSIRPFRDIIRKKTKVIQVGKVKVGGDNPISVQSMTNTLTQDTRNTIKQIQEISQAGADIVRVSCPDEESSYALKEITKHIDIPLVADIHFHYKRAIGVNAGSLERDILEKFKEPCPEALVESALRNIKTLEDLNFENFKISVKSSDVFLSVKSYKQLSKITDYPLHLGITEAGSYMPGSIKSAIGLGNLLMEGIGDTIRVSLSDDPVQEVKIGNEILKSIGLRTRGVKIISCPSCARQGFEVIDTVKILEEKLSHINQPITLSIIGCVVNGPGEAAYTDIGITGGGRDSNMLYLNGVQTEKLNNKEIISRVVELVEKKAEEIQSKIKWYL